jgi:hypothetical protein
MASPSLVSGYQGQFTRLIRLRVVTNFRDPAMNFAAKRAMRYLEFEKRVYERLGPHTRSFLNYWGVAFFSETERRDSQTKQRNDEFR